MSYLNWHVGMRVVFIGGGHVNLIGKGWRKFLPAKKLSHNLVEGEAYTIRAMTTHFDHVSNRDVVVIYLNGFAHKEAAFVGFPAQWFRPLVTRKTDISVFTAMLHGTDQTVDA